MSGRGGLEGWEGVYCRFGDERGEVRGDSVNGDKRMMGRAYVM